MALGACDGKVQGLESVQVMNLCSGVGLTPSGGPLCFSCGVIFGALCT